MTVSIIAKNKLRILLTHTEVIACFGEYEKLFGMTSGVKTALNFLINDIISQKRIFGENSKISAKLTVRRNFGCEIILTELLPKITDTEESGCLFEFEDSDALTRGIAELYKNKSNFGFKSHLYKTESGYRLLVSCKKPKERLFLLNEFCFKISENLRDIEYTKEYGKPLILNCAIEKYGEIFLK